MTSMKTALTGRASDFLKLGVASAGRGDLESVKQLLKLRPQWIHRVGSHGRTMLWEAAYRGKLEVATYLIDHGADIDACACHFTPLLVDISAYCAAKYKKREDVASLLQSSGAKIDFYTDVYLGNHERVLNHLDANPLLATDEKIQHDTNVRATALHYAVSRSRTEILALLLSRGADPRPYSYWLVRFAIWRENTEILKLLFEAGVEPDIAAVPRSGVTNPKVNSILAEYGVPCDPDQPEGGWPPLVYASRGDRGGRIEVVRKLLDQGATVDSRNYKQQTALHCAAKAGFVEIVKELLSKDALVDAIDIEGDTPLLTALKSNIKRTDRLLEVVELLVGAGADISLENKKGHSALSVASRKRSSLNWLAKLQQG